MRLIQPSDLAWLKRTGRNVACPAANVMPHSNAQVSMRLRSAHKSKCSPCCDHAGKRAGSVGRGASAEGHILCPVYSSRCPSLNSCLFGTILSICPLRLKLPFKTLAICLQIVGLSVHRQVWLALLCWSLVDASTDIFDVGIQCLWSCSCTHTHTHTDWSARCEAVLLLSAVVHKPCVALSQPMP